jgi:hypothetical protein
MSSSYNLISAVLANAAIRGAGGAFWWREGKKKKAPVNDLSKTCKDSASKKKSLPEDAGSHYGLATDATFVFAKMFYYLL